MAIETRARQTWGPKACGLYASIRSRGLTMGLPASVPNAKSNVAIPDKTRAGRRC